MNTVLPFCIFWHNLYKSWLQNFSLDKMVCTVLVLFRQAGEFLDSKNVENLLSKNSLDAGIQDKSTSISIVVKFEQVSNDDESD